MKTYRAEMEDQAKTLRARMRDNSGLRASKQSGRTRTVAVTSGKGGVGKTNIATNIAIALAEADKKVMILDADLGLANIDVILGINPKFNLRHVVSGEKLFKDIVEDGPAGIKIVPGCSGIQELADLNSIDRERFINGFSHYDSELDFIIIDTSAGIGENVVNFVLAAGETIIVTTPEPAAITDAYAMIKVINEKDPSMKISLLVNRVQSLYEARSVTDNIRMVSRHFLNRDVQSMGFILDDPRVLDSGRKQRPFIIEYPASGAAKGLRQVADRLLNKPGGTGSSDRDVSDFFKTLAENIS